MKMCRLIREDAEPPSKRRAAFAKHIPGKPHSRGNIPYIVVEYVIVRSKGCLAICDLLICGSTGAKGKVGEGRADDVKVVSELVIPEAGIDGQPWLRLPIVLDVITLIEITIKPIVG